MDQRFSVIATCLKCAATLEPQEFCDRIKAYVKPGRGRRLICETLDSVWDWKTFFQPLEIQVSGIAASPSKRDVCHSKRFVSRMDLPQMVLPGWELETPSNVQPYGPRPGYIFMCAKQWWSDPVLAQQPLLVLPQALLDRLPAGGPEHVLPSATLMQRSLDQYQKTSHRIKESHMGTDEGRVLPEVLVPSQPEWDSATTSSGGLDYGPGDRGDQAESAASDR